MPIAIEDGVLTAAVGSRLLKVEAVQGTLVQCLTLTPIPLPPCEMTARPSLPMAIDGAQPTVPVVSIGAGLAPPARPEDAPHDVQVAGGVVEEGDDRNPVGAERDCG